MFGTIIQAASRLAKPQALSALTARTVNTNLYAAASAARTLHSSTAAKSPLYLSKNNHERLFEHSEAEKAALTLAYRDISSVDIAELAHVIAVKSQRKILTDAFTTPKNPNDMRVNIAELTPSMQEFAKATCEEKALDEQVSEEKAEPNSKTTKAEQQERNPDELLSRMNELLNSLSLYDFKHEKDDPTYKKEIVSLLLDIAGVVAEEQEAKLKSKTLQNALKQKNEAGHAFLDLLTPTQKEGIRKSLQQVALGNPNTPEDLLLKQYNEVVSQEPTPVHSAAKPQKSATSQRHYSTSANSTGLADSIVYLSTEASSALSVYKFELKRLQKKYDEGKLPTDRFVKNSGKVKDSMEKTLRHNTKTSATQTNCVRFNLATLPPSVEFYIKDIISKKPPSKTVDFHPSITQSPVITSRYYSTKPTKRFQESYDKNILGEKPEKDNTARKVKNALGGLPKLKEKPLGKKEPFWKNVQKPTSATEKVENDRADKTRTP